MESIIITECHLEEITPNPLISLYNTIIHSVDDRNPHLITGIAPSGSINRTSNFFKFISSSPAKTGIKNFRFNS